MKFIYVHHAERDRNNKRVRRQEQDITEDGIKETKLLKDRIKFLGITKIYSSEYIRCIHTANIINEELNLKIKIEKRFNEWNSKKEDFKQFLERNIEALKEIKENSNEADVILCVTSGINLSAFVAYFNNTIPTNETLRCQGITTSPVLFSTDNKFY